MKEKDAMAFLVTITVGAQEGKAFRVEPGECVIGRAPTCTIILTDESVAWEHVKLRMQGGRFLLQNLSAAGTRVKGRLVSGEIRLGSSEEVELSETCKLVVSQHVSGASAAARVKPGLVLAIIGVLVVVLVGGYAVLRPKPKTIPPFTSRHFDSAYQSLEARLEEWSQRGGTGHEETLTIFRNAWRLERAFNAKAASIEWSRLRSLLLTVRRPGEENRAIAQTKESDARKALGVVSGWDPITSTSTEPYYDSDDAYADALARFVQKRSEITKKQVEDRR